MVQYLEHCSIIKVTIILLKFSEKTGFLGRIETEGNRDDWLEKCKRGEGKGKIKNWEIVWPERTDSSYLSVSLSNNSSPFRSCIYDSPL